jgi:phage virion morphogenesis protein
MLRITVQGQAGLERTLNDLSKALVVRDILDEASAVLLGRIRQRFLDETDPDGVAWIPSRASRLRAGGGTLFDTGRLFHSIQLFSVDEESRAIGTNVPYAPFHQFGTRTLPRRQFLGFSDEDATIVEGLIIKRVQEALE